MGGKGIRSQIRPNPNRKKMPGRPRLFNKTLYDKVRSMIERFFAWLKFFRRITIRYERLSSTYLGFVQLGASLSYSEFPDEF